jgi:hypothetical protein
MQGSITSASIRHMGTLIRAGIGLAIAFWLAHPQDFHGALEHPVLLAVKADIAAWRARTVLNAAEPPHIGTQAVRPAPAKQAQALHF